MTNIRKYWSVVALALVFAIGIVIRELAPTPVQAAGPPVTVIGPLPLPVSLQGTGTIAGTVNAAQTGPWSVGVNNFPATQAVSGTVGISGTPNVKVTNTTPLPVTDADELQAVQATSAPAYFTAGGQRGFVFSGPGSGKRLVIEYVTASVLSPTDNKLHYVDVTARAASTVADHFLATSWQDDDGTTTFSTVSHATRMYDDGIENFQMTAIGTAGMVGSLCTFTYSGHVVNLP